MHGSSSSATSHVLIYPRTTAKHSDLVWLTYRGTEKADQANLAKLSSTQLNLMSLHLTLVWQLSIIEHKTIRHGGCSWKWQRQLDKPHDDYGDDDDACNSSVITLPSVNVIFYNQKCLCVCLSTSYNDPPERNQTDSVIFLSPVLAASVMTNGNERCPICCS